MKPAIFPFLLACSFAAGCSSVGPGGPAGSVAYYFGPVKYTSDDGVIPYGGTESAVKREISAGGALIVETVTEPGNSPSMPAQTFVTRLERRGETLVYGASDAGKTFSGTVTFGAPDLASWSYDIKLADGKTITGRGRLTADGLTAEKLLGQAQPMLMSENLKTVSREEYERRVAAMAPPPGAE